MEAHNFVRSFLEDDKELGELVREESLDVRTQYSGSLVDEYEVSSGGKRCSISSVSGIDETNILVIETQFVKSDEEGQEYGNGFTGFLEGLEHREESIGSYLESHDWNVVDSKGFPGEVEVARTEEGYEFLSPSDKNALQISKNSTYEF